MFTDNWLKIIEANKDHTLIDTLKNWVSKYRSSLEALKKEREVLLDLVTKPLLDDNGDPTHVPLAISECSQKIQHIMNCMAVEKKQIDSIIAIMSEAKQ